jgi:hypothetical protein
MKAKKPIKPTDTRRISKPKNPNKFISAISRRLAFVIVVAVIAIGGTIYLIVSHADTPSYTCPSGYTLSGSTCTETTTYNATLTTTNSGQYTCQSGGTLAGNVCDYSSPPVAATKTPGCAAPQQLNENGGSPFCYYPGQPSFPDPVDYTYSCPSGYTTNDPPGGPVTCIDYYQGPATETTTSQYTCNPGDTLVTKSGAKTCSHQTQVPATLVAPTTAPKPATTPIPAGSGGSSGSTGSSARVSTSTTHTTTTTPKTTTSTSSTKSSGSSAQPAVTTVNLGPPGVPTFFTAKQQLESGGITLNWVASTTGSPAIDYEIDRSLDNKTWSVLDSTVNSISYTDVNTNFNTAYYYRLKAIDSSGDASGYAYSNTTTGGFKANTGPNTSLILTSQDGLTRVLIPKGALSVPAICQLNLTSSLTSISIKGYTQIYGPYDINCKDQSGNIITNYHKPLDVSINQNSDAFKGYASFLYYSGVPNSQNWAKISPVDSANKSNVNFELIKSSSFVVFGKQKQTPWWAAILIALVILILIGLVIVVAIKLIQRRKIQLEYDSMYRKSLGL